MNVYIFIENKPRIWREGTKIEKYTQGNLIVQADNQNEALEMIEHKYGHKDVRFVEEILAGQTFLVGEYSEDLYKF